MYNSNNQQDKFTNTFCQIAVDLRRTPVRPLLHKPGLKAIWRNRELTLKCKLKCYVKPMKDPLGVSPSTGNQGTTRGKEKTLLTSVGIEPTTSGLDLKSGTI